ncbi:MAG TPA: hypothetical protein VIJ93_07710 [bacterium]
MKSSLIFPLVISLVLAGTPSRSQSETNPKIIKTKEKAALTALASPDLLLQKAGDRGDIWDNGTNRKWSDKNSKVNLDGTDKNKKSSDVGSTGAVLVTIGSAIVVLFCSLIGNVNIGGGSC